MGIALMGSGSVVCPFAVGMWCFYDGTEDLSTIYPGTKWQKMEGRFLFGSNSSHTVGMTGGEENHKLTINEMPSHSHIQRKVVSNKELLDLIHEYNKCTDDYDKLYIKEKIYKYSEYREYMKYYNELFYYIMDINKRFKKYTNIRGCHI